MVDLMRSAAFAQQFYDFGCVWPSSDHERWGSAVIKLKFLEPGKKKPALESSLPKPIPVRQSGAAVEVRGRLAGGSSQDSGDVPHRGSIHLMQLSRKAPRQRADGTSRTTAGGHG